MENMISILPPFLGQLAPFFTLPYVRQQINGESGQWPVSCKSFVLILCRALAGQESCATAALGCGLVEILTSPPLGLRRAASWGRSHSTNAGVRSCGSASRDIGKG